MKKGSIHVCRLALYPATLLYELLSSRRKTNLEDTILKKTVQGHTRHVQNAFPGLVLLFVILGPRIELNMCQNKINLYLIELLKRDKSNSVVVHV